VLPGLGAAVEAMRKIDRMNLIAVLKGRGLRLSIWLHI
jgi:hypothetical protein